MPRPTTWGPCATTRATSGNAAPMPRVGGRITTNVLRNVSQSGGAPVGVAEPIPPRVEAVEEPAEDRDGQDAVHADAHLERAEHAHRVRMRSLARARSTLPSASPQRNVVSMAVKAYVELPMKNVSARVHTTS